MPQKRSGPRPYLSPSPFKAMGKGSGGVRGIGRGHAKDTDQDNESGEPAENRLRFNLGSGSKWNQKHNQKGDW